MASAPIPCRILIVEDDPSFRSGLIQLVQGLGCDVEAAATVAEALSKLDPAPTCVILDLNLPDGRGTRVLERVRSQEAGVRVAVLSAAEDPDLWSEVDRLRPDAVFRKPPDWDEFLAWVKHAAIAG